jgi:hypothetical protein
VPLKELDVPLLHLHRSFTIFAVRNNGDPLLLQSILMPPTPNNTNNTNTTNKVARNESTSVTTTSSSTTITTTTATSRTAPSTRSDGVKSMDQTEEEVIYGSTPPVASDITITITSAADSSSSVVQTNINNNNGNNNNNNNSNNNDNKQREVKVAIHEHMSAIGGALRMIYELAEDNAISNRQWFGFDNLWRVINGRDGNMPLELVK